MAWWSACPHANVSSGCEMFASNVDDGASPLYVLDSSWAHSVLAAHNDPKSKLLNKADDDDDDDTEN